MSQVRAEFSSGVVITAAGPCVIFLLQRQTRLRLPPPPRITSRASTPAYFSTAVSNVAAWSVANPALALAYERKSGALLSLDCWCVTTLCCPRVDIADALNTPSLHFSSLLLPLFAGLT